MNASTGPGPTRQPIPPDDESPENPQPDDAPAQDTDNPLESLGKAVSAPVLGAADEDPDAPEQHAAPDAPRTKER